jgi:hypothetical protein
MYTEFWLKSPKGGDYWEHRNTCEDNIKVDLRDIGFWVLIGLIWFGIRTGAGSCENDNGVLGSLKRGELFSFRRGAVLRAVSSQLVENDLNR